MNSEHKRFVLYSYTRKVMYINNTDHNRFWSKYLRSKHPKDKWFMGSDSGLAYLELSESIYNNGHKRINLADLNTNEARILHRSILGAMEAKAISKLEGDTFMVGKCSHNEYQCFYLGDNIKLAEQAFNEHKFKGVDNIEVWRDGSYADSIYGELEYRSKFIS